MSAETALKDLSDLTTEERETLSHIVERFRRARSPGTEPQAFASFWDRMRAMRSPMAQEDADQLAADAVAFARGPL